MTDLLQIEQRVRQLERQNRRLRAALPIVLAAFVLAAPSRHDDVVVANSFKVVGQDGAVQASLDAVGLSLFDGNQNRTLKVWNTAKGPLIAVLDAKTNERLVMAVSDDSPVLEMTAKSGEHARLFLRDDHVRLHFYDNQARPIFWLPPGDDLKTLPKKKLPKKRRR